MWYYIVFIVISDGLVKRKQDWESPGTRSVIVIGQERRNDHDHMTMITKLIEREGMTMITM